MSETTIRTGRHIQKMNAAIEQELLKFLGSSTSFSTLQRVVLKKAITKQAVAFEHTPGEQAAHVEGTHPSPFQDVAGQIKAQLSPTQALCLDQEIGLMLESGDLLKQGNNAIKATLHILFVRTKTFVRNLIGQGVLTRIERQGGTTEVERHRARRPST
jgi:hypothetical protein